MAIIFLFINAFSLAGLYREIKYYLLIIFASLGIAS
jgi:hypothetical protein